MRMELPSPREEASCTLASWWLTCAEPLCSYASRSLSRLSSQRTCRTTSSGAMLTLQLSSRGSPTCAVRPTGAATSPEFQKSYISKSYDYFFSLSFKIHLRSAITKANLKVHFIPSSKRNNKNQNLQQKYLPLLLGHITKWHFASDAHIIEQAKVWKSVHTSLLS